jgi:hypothetical protein
MPNIAITSLVVTHKEERAREKKKIQIKRGSNEYYLHVPKCITYQQTKVTLIYMSKTNEPNKMLSPSKFPLKEKHLKYLFTLSFFKK